jgi:L-2-hydroxyglutarate oxidase LhgO
VSRRDASFGAAVIGAGALGLASAAALARRGLEVLVLERHEGAGREISSRNSQVIHAGLYYEPGSLKAKSCVEGRRQLYERCAAHSVAHRRTGKLVVATEPDELPALEGLLARGIENGAGDLALLDGAEVARREPRLRARAALWSPESGVVDALGLVASYQAEAESLGATVLFRTRVCGLARAPGGWRVETLDPGGERVDVEVPRVVNAAGLECERIAALAGIDVERAGWRLHPCKGDYFALAPSLGALTDSLVYPVPVPGGLGIHLTRDLAGRSLLGPDVEWVEAPRYEVDPRKAELFARAAERYLPEVLPEHLSPEFAGVRPKLQAPGEPPRDFVVEESSGRGAPGLVNLIGIESPGLTAAGAIAERVAALAG